MSVEPIKLDLESTPAYSGLGDLVMLAWLAEGCRRAGSALSVHRLRHSDLMTLVGLDVAPEPGGITLDPAYKRELADRCSRPRLDYIREYLHLPVEPARPTVRIDADDRAWAASRAGELGDPLVLLFPQTAWVTREWPASYWIDLAWRLKAIGIPALVLLSDRDERFANTPHFWWGLTIPRLAALIERAALVVGNDSFPAHLSGALGVPTLALLGPTRSTVFAHCPEVDCMTANSLDCTGCHFAAPFRAACDQGCMSLFRLFPDAVLRRVLQKIPMPVTCRTANLGCSGPLE